MVHSRVVSSTARRVRPLFSREDVNRAGMQLAARDGTDALSRDQVSAVLNNWRSSHSFPLNTLQMNPRNKATSVDALSIVAQRLKRVPSIVQKLRRFPQMKLSRMQDIGGARAVVQTVSDVDALRRLYPLCQ